MRYVRVSIAATLAAAVLAPAAAHADRLVPRTLDRLEPRAPAAAPDRPAAAPGRLIVRFHASATAGDRASTLAAHGARSTRRLGSVPGLSLVKLPAGAEPRAAAAALERDPDVLYAEPDWTRHISALPNDPRMSDLWGLTKIAAPAAWDRTVGSPSVVVAVLDTGIDYNHPDLAPNIWTNPGESPNGSDDDGNGLVDDLRGWDFVNNDPHPMDDNVHGSHVAGTIAARGNNGAGITGVSQQARLMAVKVAGASGSLSDSHIIAGFDYAGRKGADVVNASFGGPAFSQAIKDAVDRWPNTLFVAAAGNGGGDGVGDDNDAAPLFPCALNSANLVCVASTGRGDALSAFSNFGAASVDLAAPGERILSATHQRVLFSDRFEQPFTGRWATGGNRVWAPTSERADGGSSSAADSPGGNYLPGTNAWFDSTPLSAAPSFASGSGCAADWGMRLDSELGHDGVFFQISLNGGGTWLDVNSYSGSSGGVFANFTEDLGPLDGFAAVDAGFQMISDGDAIVGDGAHIDNFLLRCFTGSHGSDDFVHLDGTSMATPHVAGAAALALALRPDLTTAQLRQVVLGGVDAVGGLSGKVATGGRLNVARTLQAAAAVPRPQTPGNPAQCVVPKLKGKTLAGAKKSLTNARCRLGKVTKKRSRTVKKGRVISQSPKAGSRRAVNTKVAVVVSRGR